MASPGKARALIAVFLFAGLFSGVFMYFTRGRPAGTEPGALTGAASLPSGTRVVFFGDSITAAGVWPGGYVRLVSEALGGESQVEVIGSGVEGDDVRDLQERLSRDVLSLAPTVVVVYVGVNDVASVSEGAEEAGLAVYRSGIVDLIDRIQRAGAEALVCTPGLLQERPYDGSRENLLLDRYAQVVREVAAERNAGVCDLRRAFTEYLSMNNPEGRSRGVLTLDGVHLNSAGNRFVARQMLQALGAV
ncbi:MAG: GDSL-type esterase/lipase family protein [Actinomycetota bacterium]